MYSNRREVLLFLMAALFAAVASAQPQPIFVDAKQTQNPPNGSSWCTAYPDLQQALTNADPGDEIWVARILLQDGSFGAYKPSVTHPNPPSDLNRSKTFFIPAGVQVYGGFRGANLSYCGPNPSGYPGEQARNERNPEVNLTILSGDLAGDDDNSIFPSGPATMYDDNSYHVVYMQGEDDEHKTKLSGFVVRNGYADGSAYDDQTGAGILALWSVELDNTAPVLNRLVIEYNYAETAGAGIHIAGKGPADIANCRIQHNVVNIGYGAGLNAGDHNESQNPIDFTMQNCVFYENEINTGSGAGVAFGRANVSNCTFYGNVCHAPFPWSPDDHVGACLHNGIDRPIPGPTVTLKNCIVWNNTEPQIGSRVAATYSDIQDGSWFSGQGNIQDNPLFRDADRGVVRVRVCKDGLGNLLSPTIDAAADADVLNDSTDVDDNPATLDPFPWDLNKRHRFIALTPAPSTPGYVDMGAYEECAAGDLDGNGKVDLSDLTRMLSCMGASPCESVGYEGCCLADIASTSGGLICADGLVDISDLARLLSDFGTECPAAGEPPSEAITTGDDPLTLWLRSATPEQVVEWWEAGMPPIGDW